MISSTSTSKEFVKLPVEFHQLLFLKLDCEAKKKLAATSSFMNEIFRSEFVAAQTLSNKFIYIDDRYFSWTLEKASLCAEKIFSLTIMTGSSNNNNSDRLTQRNLVSLLQVATKIRELKIHYFKWLILAELPPLSELERLEIYSIDNRTDLSVLSKYPKLISLALQNSIYMGQGTLNNLNFAPLIFLPQINELDLSSHLEIDLSTLPRLANITKLRFSRNYCRDVTEFKFLEKFPNLRILIWGQDAGTIDVLLRSHRRLHTLDLTECFSYSHGDPKTYLPLLDKIGMYNPNIEYVMPTCLFKNYGESEEQLIPSYTDGIPVTLSGSMNSTSIEPTYYPIRSQSSNINFDGSENPGNKQTYPSSTPPSDRFDDKENRSLLTKLGGKRNRKIYSPINKRVLTILDPAEANRVLHLKNN